MLRAQPAERGAGGSVVEEPEAGHGHAHAVAVAGGYDVLVAVGAARLHDPLHAVLRPERCLGWPQKMQVGPRIPVGTQL